MNTDQRLARAERILLLIVNAGRRERKRMREMDEKIAILIDAQIRNEDGFRELRELRKETEQENERKWQENERKWQQEKRAWEENNRLWWENNRQWWEAIRKSNETDVRITRLENTHNRRDED
jgi:hypothetical protein